MQELELLSRDAAGEDGTAWAALTQRHREELAAAKQRVEDSAAEVQRLTAVAASCRKEVRCPPVCMSLLSSQVVNLARSACFCSSISQWT